MRVTDPYDPIPDPVIRRRILICENDDMVASGLASCLTESGYEVVGPVHTAEEALKMAYEHLPDLALIDIALDGDIDGISVAAELAPLGVSTIVLTGDYHRACEGREYGADILIKPVGPSNLLDFIARLLQPKQKLN